MNVRKNSAKPAASRNREWQKEFFANQRKIATPSGSINYVEQGSGPVALFVHGVLLNGYLWRHQLEELKNLRRCIAVDLLAHGNTEISATQDVSVTANAHMLAEFLDALENRAGGPGRQ